MYARVLMMGKARFGEADYLYRLRRSLENAGHAVAQLESWLDGPITDDMVSSVVRSFRPTIAFWDVETIEPNGHAIALLRDDGVVVCALLRCASASLLDDEQNEFDFELIVSGTSDRVAANTLVLPVGFDAEYGRAKCSSLDKTRHAVLATQRCIGEKRALVDAVRQAVPGGSIVAFDPSWAGEYQNPELSNGAYLSRRAKYAVYYEGASFSPADIPLRIAEGCVVVADSRLKENPGLAFAEDAIVWVSDTHDADKVVRRLESTPLLYRETLADQVACCSKLPSIGDALEGVLREIESRLLRSGCRERVLAQRNKAKRFVLFGWFGACNFGDDLLLEIAAKRITRRYPESVVTAIGANAGVIERDFGFEALTPERKHEIFEMLRLAVSLSFYGGLLFDDPMADTAGITEMFSDAWIEPTGQAGVCLMAWMLGVPISFVGIGAGPLANEAPRLAVRAMGLAGARFLPRDEMTCQCLRMAGVPASAISRKVDLAFSLGAESDFFPNEGISRSLGLVPGRYFIVSLRSWNLNPPDFCERIANALDQIAGATGYNVAFVPFDQDDATIHRAVVEKMRRGGNVVVFQERPAKQDLLGLIVDSRFAFAMRLHCSILHHVLGKPAIGLDYNDKIRAHFELLSQEKALLPLDASAEKMAETALLVEANYDEISKEVCEKKDEKAGIAQEAFDDLFISVDSRGDQRDDRAGEPIYYPRAWSLNVVRLHEALRNAEQARVQRDEAIRERDAARREVEEYAQSYSYRVGSTLLSVPRKVRESLSKAMKREG